MWSRDIHPYSFSRHPNRHLLQLSFLWGSATFVTTTLRTSATKASRVCSPSKPLSPTANLLQRPFFAHVTSSKSFMCLLQYFSSISRRNQQLSSLGGVWWAIPAVDNSMHVRRFHSVLYNFVSLLALSMVSQSGFSSLFASA